MVAVYVQPLALRAWVASNSPEVIAGKVPLPPGMIDIVLGGDRMLAPVLLRSLELEQQAEEIALAAGGGDMGEEASAEMEALNLRARRLRASIRVVLSEAGRFLADGLRGLPERPTVSCLLYLGVVLHRQPPALLVDPPVAAAPPVGEMLVAFIRNGCLALRVGGVPGGGAGVGGCSCDALSGGEDTLVHLSGRCTLSSNE